ncbi:hypothetical protein FIBSPDRAFT_869863 [Athelia psychrophila]|uniref:Uncharacterized protein n=1 Tax=Athelia psychrophila TaxID=1759441 RepID=A0A166BQG9_9AGAM|nr:hypothetical protein FIBSPDRAFT_869863 [Fibularhizoctonia sp. CBS 109695]
MPSQGITASGRHAHHLPEETYQEFIALRERGLDLYVAYLGDSSRCSLEAYFVPGDEEDDSSSEEEEDGWDVDEGDGFISDSDDD